MVAESVSNPAVSRDQGLNSRAPDLAAQAANDKLNLEIAKLRVDIDEATARLREDEDRRRLEKERLFTFRTTWLPPLTAVIAVLGTLLTAWLASCTYFTQEAHRYQFNLTHDMIMLVNQLGSKDEYQRKTAPQLLSAYEDEAIPFLIANLAAGTDPDATIEALRLIKQKPRRALELHVMNALTKRADEEFKAADLADETAANAVGNFLRALGRLTPPSDSANAVQSLKGFLDRLQTLQAQIPSSHHYKLENEANEACTRLTQKACPK